MMVVLISNEYDENISVIMIMIYIDDHADDHAFGGDHDDDTLVCRDEFERGSELTMMMMMMVMMVVMMIIMMTYLSAVMNLRGAVSWLVPLPLPAFTT